MKGVTFSFPFIRCSELVTLEHCSIDERSYITVTFNKYSELLTL